MEGSWWATHCNTLQHTVTHCNKLHHTAPQRNTQCNTHITPYSLCAVSRVHRAWLLLAGVIEGSWWVPHCNTLQHAATYYETLHHTALHTLQHNHCATIQHTTKHCTTRTAHTPNHSHAQRTSDSQRGAVCAVQCVQCSVYSAVWCSVS